jgi:hypothetical protein
VYYTNDGNFSFCLKFSLKACWILTWSPRSSRIFPGCRIGVVTELTDDLYKNRSSFHILDGRYSKTLRCDGAGIEITEKLKTPASDSLNLRSSVYIRGISLLRKLPCRGKTFSGFCYFFFPICIFPSILIWW